MMKPVMTSSIIHFTFLPLRAFTYNPVAIPILSPLATIVSYLDAYINCERSPRVLHIAGICGVVDRFLLMLNIVLYAPYDLATTLAPAHLLSVKSLPEPK